MVVKKKSCSILLTNYNKNYLNESIFGNLNLRIANGEFLTILGPNGCGKSTILKSIAGLIDYEGVIKKESEKLSLVMQDPLDLLLPWLNTKSNIIFPHKEFNEEKLNKLLYQTNLVNHSEKFPHELSGGLAQTVVLTRALYHDSDVILFDEPFKSLDYDAAYNLQTMILDVWNSFSPTIIMVSHDIDSSILMSNRIIVLSKNPSKIKLDLKLDFARPRGIDFFTTKDFLKTKQVILSALKK